jgi:hypothetical protein
MSEDGVSECFASYRAVATDEPPIALDRAILAAASRRSARTRMLRCSGLAFAVAGCCIVASMPLWQWHQASSRIPRGEVGYGRQEGLSRYYLLNGANTPYANNGHAGDTK